MHLFMLLTGSMFSAGPTGKVLLMPEDPNAVCIMVAIHPHALVHLVEAECALQAPLARCY